MGKALKEIDNAALVAFEQRLESAKIALSECKTITEAKRIRDQAEAIRHLVQVQGFGLDCQNQAAELKLRAERRLGEIYAGMPENRGRKKKCHDETISSKSNKEKLQSHRWKRVASVPEDAFENHVKKTSATGELTTASVLKLAKSIGRRAKVNGYSDLEESKSESSLSELIAGGQKFGTIYADPPWQYGNQATRAATDNHYPTMTVDEIAALPIGDLAAKDCHLHLWTTNAFLFEVPPILKAWGFTYKSVFIWCKEQMGIGNYWRVSHEFLIFAVRGNAPFGSRSLKSWVTSKRGKHSSKPYAVRKMVEQASPGPRLELFGREDHDGWTVWGNQVQQTLFTRGK